MVRARTLFEAAGDAEALWYLSQLHARGDGVPADRGAALRYLRQSADLGYLGAVAGVGEAYYYGNGVPKDAAIAKEWFLKAAEKGHAGAQYALGMLYTRGEGVVADPERALEWFRRAARNGHVDAQIRLGNLLAGQPGAPPDVQEEALFWLGVAIAKLKPGPLRTEAEAAARSVEQRLTPGQIDEVRKRRADRGAEPSAGGDDNGASSGQN
jgi:TPR repeat protein